LVAMQDLAKYWLKKCNYKVLAISGSNGKTTSKEYAKCIISAQKKITASKGSFNNHWGVPMTILNSNLSDDVLLLEMGMNHLGELKQLSELAEQDVSCLTTIGQAHVGEVGSLQNIIEAKKELYDHSPKATHIFNLDNEHTLKMYNESNINQKLSFSSKNSKADVFMKLINVGVDGIEIEGHISEVKNKLSVPVYGGHNLYNIMSASCLALTCGLTPEQIWQVLPSVKGAWGRCDLFKLDNGVQILFDAYNSNPQSVTALHHSLSQFNTKGKKVFIFGDMLELGDQSESLHIKTIETMKSFYDIFWYIGEHINVIQNIFKNTKTKLLTSTQFDKKTADNLHKKLFADDLVILKGSRGLELEQVVQAWGKDYKK